MSVFFHHLLFAIGEPNMYFRFISTPAIVLPVLLLLLLLLDKDAFVSWTHCERVIHTQQYIHTLTIATGIICASNTKSTMKMLLYRAHIPSIKVFNAWSSLTIPKRLCLNIGHNAWKSWTKLSLERVKRWYGWFSVANARSHCVCRSKINYMLIRW